MERKENRGKSKKIRIVLLCLFGAVFCVSTFLAATDLLDLYQSSRAFDKLRGEVFMTPPPEETTPAATPTPQGTGSGGEDLPVSAPPDWRDEQLARYAALKEENPDFYGWIHIDGTQLSYPVMYTPNDPEHYLRRTMDGKYSLYGVPFLDAACYEGCGNFIVYGHHTNNGTMFNNLPNYAKREYWEEHPIIRFDTVDSICEYEVVGAFYSRVYNADDHNVFRYYQYKDLSDPAVFAEYVANVKAAARYNTGVEAEYGDQLLTLTTCSYHTTDGRFVVVARRISRYPADE